MARQKVDMADKGQQLTICENKSAPVVCCALWHPPSVVPGEMALAMSPLPSPKCSDTRAVCAPTETQHGPQLICKMWRLKVDGEKTHGYGSKQFQNILHSGIYLPSTHCISHL